MEISINHVQEMALELWLLRRENAELRAHLSRQPPPEAEPEGTSPPADLPASP